MKHSSEEEIDKEESIVDSNESAESYADDDDDSDNEEEEEEEDHDNDDNNDNDNNADKNLTLSSDEKNSTEVNNKTNGEDESVKISRKKEVLTKQQKKAQKLEKKKNQKIQRKEELTAERKVKASIISTERLLTDEDFRTIDVALAKQEVTYAKRGVKRTRDQIEAEKQNGELVKLSDIENIHKKRKHDKAARLESVKVRRKYRNHTHIKRENIILLSLYIYIYL